MSLHDLSFMSMFSTSVEQTVSKVQSVSGVPGSIGILEKSKFTEQETLMVLIYSFRTTSLSKQVVGNLNYALYHFNIVSSDKQPVKEKNLAVTTCAILPPTIITKTHQRFILQKQTHKFLSANLNDVYGLGIRLEEDDLMKVLSRRSVEQALKRDFMNFPQGKTWIVIKTWI